MMIGQPSNEFKSSDTLDMLRPNFLAPQQSIILATIFDTHDYFFLKPTFSFAERMN